MIKQVAAVLVAVLAASGCASSPSHSPLKRPTTHPNASGDWKSFVQPSATSGCPSEACSDILTQVQAGATTYTVPSDLAPSIQDASNDMQMPAGGTCTDLPGVQHDYAPCVFGSGPLMVLIGNSRAGMWSEAVLALSQQLGYQLAVVQHEGCSMPRVAHPTHTGSVSAEECKTWEDAAVNWVKQHNPAVVLVASGPDLSDQVNPRELTTGYVAVLNEMAAPNRKLFVFGEMPHQDQSAPNCLAANTTSATKCGTPPEKAVQVDEQQADLDAAHQAGAGYVNLTPWLCTNDLCPAIIGHYLAYHDQTHLTSTYTKALVPVLGQVLKVHA